jgi:hypothetical protein
MGPVAWPRGSAPQILLVHSAHTRRKGRHLLLQAAAVLLSIYTQQPTTTLSLSQLIIMMIQFTVMKIDSKKFCHRKYSKLAHTNILI